MVQAAVFRLGCQRPKFGVSGVEVFLQVAARPFNIGSKSPCAFFFGNSEAVEKNERHQAVGIPVARFLKSFDSTFPDTCFSFFFSQISSSMASKSSGRGAFSPISF